MPLKIPPATRWHALTHENSLVGISQSKVPGLANALHVVDVFVATINPGSQAK